MKVQIINWLLSDKEYNSGLILYQNISNNKALIRELTRKRNPTKLEYELKKLAGIPREKLFKQTCSNAQLINSITIDKSPVIVEKPKKEPSKLPDAITQAKNIIVELYMKIAMMHDELYNLGDGNDKSIVAKRKRLLDKRKPFINKYNQLYNEKEEYFKTGKISPALIELLKKTDDKIVQDIKVKPFTHLVQMHDIELIKRKNALSTSITKTQNKINYQSITKKDTPCPLPEGPKKDELLQKLKRLKREYNQIIKLIEERS